MRRAPEPELMLDEAQSWAHAEADFPEAHDLFIQSLQQMFGTGLKDIFWTWAAARSTFQAYPGCT